MATNIANLTRVCGQRLENFEVHPPKNPIEIELFFSSGMCLKVQSISPDDEDTMGLPLETVLIGKNYDTQYDTEKYIDKAVSILAELQEMQGGTKSLAGMRLNAALLELSQAKASYRKEIKNDRK